MVAVPNSSQDALDLTGRLGSSLYAGVGWTKIPFPVVLAGLAGTAKVVDNFTFGFNGRVASLEFVCTVPASTAAKAATITPSLGGTNITGGVLALTTDNCTAGAVVAASAITALNIFDGGGDVFDLTLSSVTAFVEGSGVIFVNVWNDDLRRAVGLSLSGLTPS